MIVSTLQTVAQVVIRWFVDQSLVVIPKSVTPSRIVENLNVFDFHLDADDLAVIDKLAEVNWRILTLEANKEHPHYPFH